MRKKILWVTVSILGLYLIGTYLYFTIKPALKDSCPIILAQQQPLVLTGVAGHLGHKFQVINDASCLNPTRVYEIITVKNIADIQQALKTAQTKNLQIAIAGVRHSMGGQAFFTDALVLDMASFNKIISLDENKKLLTVESGATWHDIQIFLNAKNLAVKAMQSTDIFTVGGSLSVNAHGMDHNVGSMADTVHSFTIMLANGVIEKVTRISNPELFNAVIGGYGLFGIVLNIELEVTDNVMYQRETIFLDYWEVPNFFAKAQSNQQYGLLYAHLSTSPWTFLRTAILYGYKPIAYTGQLPELGNVSFVKLRRFLINLAKKRHYGRVIKWLAEKYIDPAIDKLSQRDILSRNEVMHDSVEYLDNILIDETDILQEYFVPQRHYAEFIESMKTVLKQSKIPILNVSVRAVHQETMMLNYAPEDMLAIVLYLNQRVYPKALQRMADLTQDLIDLAIKFEGTFFLPYQLSFTKQQLQQAYPNIAEFFELKRKYDPGLLFMNNFYAKYN